MRSLRWSIFTISLGLASTVWAGSTCPNIDMLLDNTLWEDHSGCNQNYKDWFTDFYEFHKQDWDEGWGWKKCEPQFEFVKMWNASVLMSWIDHTRTGRWKLDSIQDLGPDASGVVTDLTPNLWGPPAASQPVVFVDFYGIAWVFIRSGAGEIIHYRYDTAEFNPSTTLNYVNVSQISSNPSGSALTFQGPVSVRLVLGERLAVFGLSGSTPAPMVLFLSTGSGWEARPLVPGGLELQVATPAVLRADSGATYLIGVNGSGRLVEYMLSPNYDLNSIVMLPFLEAVWRASKDPAGLVAMIVENRINVFVPRDPDGKLLHFWRDLPNGTWTAQNLTDAIESAPSMVVGSRLALIKRSGPNLTIFGRNSSGELIRYARDRKCTVRLAAYGCVLRENVWAADNISRAATVDASPPSGQTWILDTTFTDGPYAALAPDGTERVFGIGLGLFTEGNRNHVKYYYQTKDQPAVWRKTDLTMNTTGAQPVLMADVQTTIGIPRVTLLTGGDGVRFFVLNVAGRLVRYRCTRAGEPCSSQVAGDQNPPSLHTAFQPGGTFDPVVGDHVIGIQVGSRRLLHHQFIGDHAWHASEDYENWASGHIHDFHYEPRDETPDDRIAEAQGGLWQSDEVHLFCQSFNSVSPSERTAIMLHEATHIHFWGDFDHTGDDDRDPFLLHGLGEIPPGSLDAEESGHKHSPYQIEIEYLADLAQFAYDSVPFILRTVAESSANSLLNNRIAGEPGWKVGLPRPM